MQEDLALGVLTRDLPVKCPLENGTVKANAFEVEAIDVQIQDCGTC